MNNLQIALTLLFCAFIWIDKTEPYCIVAPVEYYNDQNGNIPYCPSYAGIRVNTTFCVGHQVQDEGTIIFFDAYGWPDVMATYRTQEYTVGHASYAAVGVLGATLDGFNCTSDVVDVMDCEAACVFQTTAEFTCSGDELYCNYTVGNFSHTCTTPNFDCNCNTTARWRVPTVTVPVKYNLTLPLEWELIPDNEFVVVCANLTIGIDPVTASAAGAGSPPPVVSTTHSNAAQGVFTKLDGKILTVTIEGPALISLVLRKDDWFYYVDLNQTTWSYTLPDTVFIRNGPLYVIVMRNGGAIIDTTYDLIAEVVCRLHDCLFCASAFTDWACVPTSHRVGIILILILLFLAFCMLVPCFYWSLFYSCTLCFWPLFRKLMCLHKTKLGRKIRSWTRSKYQRIGQELEEPEQETMEMGVSEDFVSSRDMSEVMKKMPKLSRNGSQQIPTPRGGSGFKPSTFLSVVCILSLCLPSTFACDFGSSLVGTFTDCVKVDDTHDTCKVFTSIQTTLDRPGFTSCYSLYDDNKENFANMEVHFASQTDTVTLTKAYYTSPINVIYGSIKECYGAGQCRGQRCEDFEASDDRDPYEMFASRQDLLTFPGDSFCRRVPGCWGEGCFYCTSACAFSGYAVKPVGQYYTVYNIGQRSTSPAIQITITSGAGIVKQTSLNAISNSTTVDGFSVKILGNLQGTVTEFGNDKVISAAGYVWLGSASDANVPVAGAIGQIQANTLSKLNTGDFTVASGIVSRNQGSKSDDFSFIDTPIPSTPAYKKFPFSMNAVVWSDDITRAKIVGTNMNPGPLIVSIETPVALSVTRVRNVVCPHISKVGPASGCFACKLGSVASVIAKSTCRGGVVAVETDDDSIVLFTTSLSLDTSDFNYTINFEPSKEEGSFELCLRSDTSKDCATIKYVAVEDALVQPRLEVQGNNTDIKDPSGSTDYSGWNFFTKGIPDFFTKKLPKFFDDIIKGLASWWEYLIFILVGLAVILFLVWKFPRGRAAMMRVVQRKSGVSGKKSS